MFVCDGKRKCKIIKNACGSIKGVINTFEIPDSIDTIKNAIAQEEQVPKNRITYPVKYKCLTCGKQKNERDLNKSVCIGYNCEGTPINIKMRNYHTMYMYAATHRTHHLPTTSDVIQKYTRIDNTVCFCGKNTLYEKCCGKMFTQSPIIHSDNFMHIGKSIMLNPSLDLIKSKDNSIIDYTCAIQWGVDVIFFHNYDSENLTLDNIFGWDEKENKINPDIATIVLTPAWDKNPGSEHNDIGGSVPPYMYTNIQKWAHKHHSVATIVPIMGFSAFSGGKMHYFGSLVASKPQQESCTKFMYVEYGVSFWSNWYESNNLQKKGQLIGKKRGRTDVEQ
jgi:hypothetical protein